MSSNSLLTRSQRLLLTCYRCAIALHAFRDSILTGMNPDIRAQGFVSLRRIEKYLASPEVSPIPSLAEATYDIRIALHSATITWPQDRSAGRSRSIGPSAAATPSLNGKFVLRDLSISIPVGEMTLVCGKLGSGKSLLLLALLGEADLLAGQIICPRTPPESLAVFAALDYIHPSVWVLPGVVAYVPQSVWLQNASIKDNILFSLPYDEKRYNATLEVSHSTSDPETFATICVALPQACALVADLKIIEDGDEAEIGERGVNLSGGQKARGTGHSDKLIVTLNSGCS